MGLNGNKPKRRAGADLLQTVNRTIADHRMLGFGDAVLIAVSGGADSVVLAHVLHLLAPEYGLRLAVAHLNHKLRDQESDRDAEFVAEFCRNLGIPLYSEAVAVADLRLKLRISLEEAAREARYTYFEALSERHRFTKIATGHQARDNAELVLLNLLRGSGPLGLSGIRAVRNGRIIRPLIRLHRSDIMGYIEENDLSYVTDSSNYDLSIRRNRIRHQLVPELERNYNPQIVTALNRLGNIMRAEYEWLDSLIQADFENCSKMEALDAVTIDLTCVADVDIAAKRRLIRKAICAVNGDLRRITLQHIEAVRRLADTGPTRGRLNLPDSIQVSRAGSMMHIVKDTDRRPNDRVEKRGSNGPDYIYTIQAPGVLSVHEAGLRIQLTEIPAADLPDFAGIGEDQAFLDMENLKFPLIVRNMRDGDRFSPLGVNGTQKLKKFFTDHKIYGHRRRICPLLVCRDKIIWVSGHRIDDSVKIVPKTRRVLKAELLLA